MTIYQLTNEFLIETFDKSSCKCEFNETHAKELTSRIQAFDKEAIILDSQKKEQIRMAFSDFFIECGKVAIFFKGTEKIIIKLVPYKTHPAENELIQKIYTYLKSVLKDINHGQDDDIIKIPEKYSHEIDHIFKTISAPIDTRKIIRKAVATAFELSEKDIILFINKKIVIRKFCEAKACERRFEGLPPDEVKNIVDSLYPQIDAMQTDLEITISYLADTTLNFSNIDNQYFEKNRIKIIQKALKEYIKKKLSHPDIVITAVVNYIFRNAFNYIHEILAEKLLELIKNKDKNAETFIKYYNGNTVIEDGTRYVTPSIMDSNEQIWNVSMIVNFMSQYEREKNNLKQKASALNASKREYSEIKKKLEENTEESPERLKKREDFLLMRIETETKNLEMLQEKQNQLEEKYDQLIIATSEALINKKETI